MTERGFEVSVADLATFESSAILARLLDRVHYGFQAPGVRTVGLVDSLEAASATDPELTPAHDYGAPFAQAEFGTFPPSQPLEIQTGDGGTLIVDLAGCLGQSYIQLFGTPDHILAYTQYPSMLQAKVDSIVDGDTRVINAKAAWSKCASNTGREFADPAEALTALVDTFNSDSHKSARRFEEVLVRLFAECDKSSDLLTQVRLAQTEAEKRVRTSNTAELSLLAQAMSAAGE